MAEGSQTLRNGDLVTLKLTFPKHQYLEGFLAAGTFADQADVSTLLVPPSMDGPLKSAFLVSEATPPHPNGDACGYSAPV